MSFSTIPGSQNIDIFWGELAACEHSVQIYENEAVFIRTLHSFIREGLLASEATIIIATPAHLQSLETLLIEDGIDLVAARKDDRYIALDAEETLLKFMVNNWPDDELFTLVITDVLLRAKQNGRKVRAFGEMVALLWAQGHCGATVRLEHLWTALCNKEEFSLFCAYPKAGFTSNAAKSISEVCAAHSKVVAL